MQASYRHYLTNTPCSILSRANAHTGSEHAQWTAGSAPCHMPTSSMHRSFPGVVHFFVAMLYTPAIRNYSFNPNN